MNITLAKAHLDLLAAASKRVEKLSALDGVYITPGWDNLTLCANDTFLLFQVTVPCPGAVPEEGYTITWQALKARCEKTPYSKSSYLVNLADVSPRETTGLRYPSVTSLLQNIQEEKPSLLIMPLGGITTGIHLIDIAYLTSLAKYAKASDETLRFTAESDKSPHVYHNDESGITILLMPMIMPA